LSWCDLGSSLDGTLASAVLVSTKRFLAVNILQKMENGKDVVRNKWINERKQGFQLHLSKE